MILFDDWHTVKRGNITTLLHGNQYIMDDCPLHLSIIRKHINQMRGHVLCTGLGMGCFLDEALQNPEITKITCVDKEQKLIDYYVPQYPNVEFLCVDVFNWVPTKKFDFIWHDIFSELNQDTIQEYIKLKKAFEKHSHNNVLGLFDGYIDNDERLQALTQAV